MAPASHAHNTRTCDAKEHRDVDAFAHATCTNSCARAGAGARCPTPAQVGGGGAWGGCCGGRGGFMIENSAPGTVTDT